MVEEVERRDGSKVKYDRGKIMSAINKAIRALDKDDIGISEKVTNLVEEKLSKLITTTVEDIQDLVEDALMSLGYNDVAKEYILFRANRNRVRGMNTGLMRTFEELTFGTSNDIELKRENANVDGDTSMGTMLRYGSEASKAFSLEYLVSPRNSRAHKNGDIHIHDLDFTPLTETCCQIDIDKLFKGGFDTGHGNLREPGEIRSYAALACIAIQANQNEMHKLVA